MEKKPTILIIDDDEMNREIMEESVHQMNVHCVHFASAVSALEYLYAGEDADVILLDWMMPGMDGMTFLKKIKSHEQLRRIPVIMQTARTEVPAQVQGIRAGVFHYLTKPYNNDILQALVQSALHHAQPASDKMELPQIMSIMAKGLECASFQIATLEEANHLSGFLALAYPDPAAAQTGLLELMVNAIEHGNLGITYEEKTNLLQQGDWVAEVMRRQALPENAERKVKVEFSVLPDVITLTITDQGAGFEVEKYLENAEQQVLKPHGRGIALSKLISFDSLEYEKPGNVVHAEVYRTGNS